MTLKGTMCWRNDDELGTCGSSSCPGLVWAAGWFNRMYIVQLCKLICKLCNSDDAAHLQFSTHLTYSHYAYRQNGRDPPQVLFHWERRLAASGWARAALCLCPKVLPNKHPPAHCKSYINLSSSLWCFTLYLYVFVLLGSIYYIAGSIAICWDLLGSIVIHHDSSVDTKPSIFTSLHVQFDNTVWLP